MRIRAILILSMLIILPTACNEPVRAIAVALEAHHERVLDVSFVPNVDYPRSACKGILGSTVVRLGDQSTQLSLVPLAPGRCPVEIQDETGKMRLALDVEVTAQTTPVKDLKLDGHGAFSTESEGQIEKIPLTLESGHPRAFALALPVFRDPELSIRVADHDVIAFTLVNDNRGKSPKQSLRIYPLRAGSSTISVRGEGGELLFRIDATVLTTSRHMEPEDGAWKSIHEIAWSRTE